MVLKDAYREMAAHYSAAVLPGRIRHAKCKPSVENIVWHEAMLVIVELRDKRIASLPELKSTITERVEAYNAEPFQRRPGSRANVFSAEEQPLLSPLTTAAYDISRWVYWRRVARNGHMFWQKNHCSVPFVHIGTTVDLRITDRSLEVYRGQERLSSHLLLPGDTVNEHRTNDAYLPSGGQYQPWDAARVREWAERIGPSAVIVVNRIFESVPVEDQGLNPALAVLRLSRRYSAQRVESACQLALAVPVRSPQYAHLHPILTRARRSRASTFTTGRTRRARRIRPRC